MCVYQNHWYPIFTMPCDDDDDDDDDDNDGNNNNNNNNNFIYYNISWLPVKFWIFY